MATTYTFTPEYDGLGRRGKLKALPGVLTLAAGSTYTAGGDVVPASIFSFVHLERVVFDEPVTTIGQVPLFVGSSNKIKLFEEAAAGASMAEVGAGDATAGAIHVVAVGY